MWTATSITYSNYLKQIKQKQTVIVESFHQVSSRLSLDLLSNRYLKYIKLNQYLIQYIQINLLLQIKFRNHLIKHGDLQHKTISHPQISELTKYSKRRDLQVELFPLWQPAFNEAQEVNCFHLCFQGCLCPSPDAQPLVQILTLQFPYKCLAEN